MRWTHLALIPLAVAAACDTITEADLPDPEDGLELEYIFRGGLIEAVPDADLPDITLARDSVLGEGDFMLRREVGRLALQPPGTGPDAIAEAYSNVDGGTYWAWAQAPTPSRPDSSVTPQPLIGSSASLVQAQAFRKVSASAGLRFVISRTVLHALDDNGDDPQGVCPWLGDNAPPELACSMMTRGTIFFDVEAWTDFDTTTSDFEKRFFLTGGAVRLHGYDGHWTWHAYTTSGGGHFWGLRDFEWRPDPSRPLRGGEYQLTSPIVIEIPLDSLGVGDTLGIWTDLKVRAYSRRGGEAYMAAYFRDPIAGEGAELIATGLEPVALPGARPAEVPPPVCSDGAGPSGTMQFDSLEYYEPEQHGGSAWVTVSRKGGSDGMAAVRVLTRDYTADAYTDYEPGERLVIFADGEDGVRMVDFTIVSDTVAEPVESFYVDLVRIPGCGELGGLHTASVVVFDDDNPPPEPELFSLGGTVSGVVGTGLVLTNLLRDTIMPDNGPFTFDKRYPRGYGYDVRVTANPDGPAQACTVTNGDGYFDDADVTDVLVACETVELPDDLDPSFGIDGKVTSSLFGGARDMVLQPDGRIVVVGETQLARHLADGSPDTGFGSGGSARLTVPGGSLDLKGLALQDDGALVAVGLLRSGNILDWVVARVLPDGTPDPSFGSGGYATLDFFGLTDIAYDVAVQSDGFLVVGGHAQEIREGIVYNDFAVARFTPAGALDTGYGTAGWRTTDIAGKTDLGYALALQADGRAILAGRVANSGGADPDFGVVRYTTTGELDDGFGAHGIVRFATDDVWDEAGDVIVQPDGYILVGGQSNAGLSRRFALMRLDPSGVLDPTFGVAGLAFVGFDREGDYLKGLSWDGDGILAVGATTLAGHADFAVTRVLLDGSVDESFATDGKLLVDFFGSGDVAEAVVVQADGRIVVAGSAYEGIAQGLGMARITR